MKIESIPLVSRAMDRQRIQKYGNLSARVKEAQRVADCTEEYGPDWWASEKVRDEYLTAIIEGRILIGS